jgi:hypothetical protein
MNVHLYGSVVALTVDDRLSIWHLIFQLTRVGNLWKRRQKQKEGTTHSGHRKTVTDGSGLQDDRLTSYEDPPPPKTERGCIRNFRGKYLPGDG